MRRPGGRSVCLLLLPAGPPRRQEGLPLLHPRPVAFLSLSPFLSSGTSLSNMFSLASSCFLQLFYPSLAVTVIEEHWVSFTFFSHKVCWYMRFLFRKKSRLVQTGRDRRPWDVNDGLDLLEGASWLCTSWRHSSGSPHSNKLGESGLRFPFVFFFKDLAEMITFTMLLGSWPHSASSKEYTTGKCCISVYLCIYFY